ncbi:MAG TPA: DUF2127 domain-containing protein [Candidatus Aquilonibacter sp.]|nr:DUF2127 domain-containing protein [Candidatus Aquilonibacter sp.]
MTTATATATPPAKPHALRREVLHESFRVGIMLKGLHALLETIGGIVLLRVSPQTWNRVLMSVVMQNLSQDQHDFVVRHLREAFERLADGGGHFASWYLLSHGGVKLCLVIALLWNKLWAYPMMIVMLSAFVSYQLYRYHLTHSIAMIVLTVFDLIVIVLTALEYRQQIALRHGSV